MPDLTPQTAASLPTVEALQRLWQKVNAEPLWSRPNFWRWVRLRRRMSLRTIAFARVRITAPAGKINDCSTCTDICCVGPRSTVLLRLRDIATLMDIGRTDLMTTHKPRFNDDEQSSHPALRRHVASDAWRTFPVLRQDSMGACAALSRSGQCTLYPHWPLSCARFPYSLHADQREVFYSGRCESYWIRPGVDERIDEMARAAVDSYNERIRDAVLLEYARDELQQVGLLTFVGGYL